MSRIVADEAQARGAGLPGSLAHAGGWLRRRAGALVGLLAAGLICGAALLALNGLAASLDAADVSAALARVEPARIACAVLFTALSYGALVGYEILALRHLGARHVSTRTAAYASFVGQSFTFTLGFGVVTGGAVRLRAYAAAGLDPARILSVSLLCTLTFWLGITSVAALGALAATTLVPGAGEMLRLGPEGLRLVQAGAAAVLLAVAAYLVQVARAPRTLRLRGTHFSLPGLGWSLAALGFSVLDTVAAAAALHLLVPGSDLPGFLPFLGVFAVATVAGIVSQVPGGLGVFEAAMLVAFPGAAAADLLAALLLFRLVYFAGPFLIATSLVLARELQGGSGVAVRAAGRAADLVRPWMPTLCAMAVFAGGAVLLLSGALPAERDRLHLLRQLVPLPFVETSHLLASIAGLCLVVVASGLKRRLAHAWRAAVLFLGAGAVFSLFKGVDYEEALLCGLLLGMLLFGRREFYRRSDFFQSGVPLDWIIAMLVAIAASLWLGTFLFRHVEYANDLWWRFAYRQDAPRFLRASLAVAVAALALASYALLHRPPRRLKSGCDADLRRAAAVVAEARHTDAQLALLGDKRFLFADAPARGFVMYGVQGKSLVAMGDPVAGDAQTRAALVWRFRELADAEHGMPVFYQVTPDHLPIYLDAGFSLVKLGEEAIVDLASFTLEGGEGRRLRQQKARALREGLSFAVIPADRVAAHLPALREVSDAWLAGRGGEKGFSLGFWNEDYLCRFDIAVVRHGEEVVAFANLWRGAGQEEFSVDLMRHHPAAPPGTMDIMFISLMEAAKAQGYARFNLGVAPLSGLPNHRLMSPWSRLAGFIYRRGDRFYNFEGLRAFKEKFKPSWRPRYLAYVGGLSLPQVLFDVTRLLARGPEGLGRER